MHLSSSLKYANKDYVDLMDKDTSDFFLYFKSLLLKGLLALKANNDEIIFIVKTMCYQSTLPCFEKFELSGFLDRFKLDFEEEEMKTYVDWLIEQSIFNNRTVWYDEFQKMTNNIEP